jgi:HAD superfamily hydrolase (TIGR01509 family)
MQAFIFDFNGTLFQDSDKHEAAWQQFALEQFQRKVTTEEYQIQVHGRNNREILTYFAGHPLDDATVVRLAARKEAIYRQLCLADPAHLKLAPGAIALLDTLKQRQVPRTIATAAPQANLAFYRTTFDLERWFDWQQVVYDNGQFRSKPHPDPYLQAAKQLQQSPEHCVVFEDSASGIEAAYRAKVGQIVALETKHNGAQLAQLPGVTHVLTDFRALTPTQLEALLAH